MTRFAAPCLKHVLCAGALLSCIGMARIAFYDGFVARGLTRGTPIDLRYEELASRFPPDAELGYLTDERCPADGHCAPRSFTDLADLQLYTQALYSLAPRVLMIDAPDAGEWVADLVDPASLQRLASERGLEPTAVLQGGRLALLQRRRDR